MEIIGFTHCFPAFCYQFHGNINVLGRGALHKLWFSSVFEAHASKTCEPPLETMISMHVVRGPAGSEAPLFPT